VIFAAVSERKLLYFGIEFRKSNKNLKEYEKNVCFLRIMWYDKCIEIVMVVSRL